MGSGGRGHSHSEELGPGADSEPRRPAAELLPTLHEATHGRTCSATHVAARDLFWVNQWPEIKFTVTVHSHQLFPD